MMGIKTEESRKIRQRIFRYLGGHKIILEMLRKGILIFDTYIDVYRNNDPKISEKYRLETA